MDGIHEEFEQSCTPHDAAFRLAFRRKDIAEAFFRHHLPEKLTRHMDFGTLELVPGSFVDENLRQTHADLVYRVSVKGKPVLLYILFEHQSTPDPRMPFRALCYMVNIWKDFERNQPDEPMPMILPVVLYHGQRKWNAPLNFRDMLDGYNEDFAAYTPDFAYHLFDLNIVDDDGLTAGGNMALAVVLHLFKHIFDEFFGEVFQGASGLMIDIEDERVLTEILEWLIMYALNARNENAGEIIDIVEQAGKIGKEKIRRIIMTAAEQLRQEGKLAGLQEGLQEGLQQGLLKGEQRGKVVGFQEVLLRQIKKRFGQMSDLLEQRLRQADLDALERFGEAIFDFTSLEDAEGWWERRD